MYSDIIILIFALTFAASGTAYLFISKKCADQQRQLAAMGKDLDTALASLNNPNQIEIFSEFETDLEEAERKSKIDLHPVSSQKSNANKETIPARYRHVTTLASHGVDSNEISAILHISPNEVDQLIKLSQLTSEQAC